ncbi:xanthine dehydrogenase family protein molybdopterin-binding subunit [Lysobacter arenosi]|uniref:Xanthine dehydrogenase family protein molybdopterin-binding subunit n=1 Tax=Lysobacter arenosi TaxID=2795387 RepID=A0ABX7RCK4_9GAMM|nr:molybdopterin cofactor-binding domain-containing protein [Lysobacter arenosi]QSX75893.1 xanthine dehydrogenase family protein molybdopterin-binding subunit [Lysobacter arenosi]
MSTHPRDEHLAAAIGDFRQSRRAFLQTVAVVGGSLVVGFSLDSPALAARAAKGAQPWAANAFIRIAPTGAVTLVVPYVEMGQGAYTSQAQLLAEELDIGMDQLTVEHAPPDEKLYSHPVYGGQITGGSASLPGSWATLRQAGADTRSLMVAAAAKRWKASPAECRTERGQVIHTGNNQRLGYGDLVAVAATLPAPTEKAPLKPIADYKLVGHSVKRVDTPAKVNGTAKFGIDALPKGVRFAAIRATPVFGGRVAGVDQAPALAVRGVKQVVVLDDLVAVVADNTWAARKGLAALDIRWNEGANARLDTAALVAQCDAALEREGVVAVKVGDVAQARAAKTYEATFRQPMLAHAAMEPINCTAHVSKDRCEVWVGCQVLGRAQKRAAEASGLPLEKVVVHNHLLGGGFGRRLEADYVTQAVRIAKHVDAPVKVTWSREEDIQQDYFRYHNHSRVWVGTDRAGMPVSFRHRVVGPAIMAVFLPIFFKDGVDYDAVNGAAGPYDFPNALVDYVRQEPPEGLHVGNWRGVGHTRNVFVVESVIDDLAQRAGVDPVEYRRRLLGKSPRSLAVVDLAAEKAGWGRKLEKGQGLGMSVQEGFGSFLATVAQVRVAPDGKLKVERVVCAIDCGVAVNPDIVKAQLMSGVIFGLSAALYGKVTVANGRIVESNFDSYPVVRMREAPPVEVHIVSSTLDPGGVGEPGTSGILPAITNAIFHATGKRIFDLPIDTALLKGGRHEA